MRCPIELTQDTKKGNAMIRAARSDEFNELDYMPRTRDRVRPLHRTRFEKTETKRDYKTQRGGRRFRGMHQRRVKSPLTIPFPWSS